MELNVKLIAGVVVGIIIVFVFLFNTIGAKEESPPPLFETPEITQEKNSVIYVDIKGEVFKPGVYKLREGQRMYDLIEQAGGVRQNAETSNLNMARRLIDGEMIVITDGENTKETDTPTNEEESLININKASKETLVSLPNIGPASANAIIEYREKNGAFENKDDLKNVSGIGSATLEKIRALIVL